MSRNTIKVLNFTSHNEECGIGKYQEALVSSLDTERIQSDFYDTSPNIIKRLSSHEMKIELDRLTETARKYDVVHIQHEFGFFSNSGDGLRSVVEAIKKSGKPMLLTIHTAPELIYHQNRLMGHSPRNILGYMRRRMINRKIMKLRLAPFRTVDRIITFNEFTRRQLVELVGVDPSNIHKTMLPVMAQSIKKDNSLRKGLGFGADDVLLCTVGFLNENKGTDHAIKALALLPSNYKLCILGGIHPDSGNPQSLDTITDLIVSLKLEDRVKITGYIEDDELLNRYIKSCDLALYPYSPTYYRMASSDAINRPLGVGVGVIAYPTASFKEINEDTPGTLVLTKTPNYYELAREVLAYKGSESGEYVAKHNYAQAAKELESIYTELVTGVAN